MSALALLALCGDVTGLVQEETRDNREAALVLSLAFHESRCQPAQVNRRTGAVGLLQVMPMHKPPRDLRGNVRAGVGVLRWFEKRCKSRVATVAGYHGRGCTSHDPWARSVVRLADRLRLHWEPRA